MNPLLSAILDSLGASPSTDERPAPPAPVMPLPALTRPRRRLAERRAMERRVEAAMLAGGSEVAS